MKLLKRSEKRKIRIYIEPSALFKAYIPERGSENMETTLSILGYKVVGVTSKWTVLEIIRGIMKRKNMGELTDEDASDIIEFFINDIKTMALENKILLEEVSEKIINASIELIRKYNLYASDALHIKTAEKSRAKVILVDDYHFQRIKGTTRIKILNVDTDKEIFENELNTLISKKKK